MLIAILFLVGFVGMMCIALGSKSERDDFYDDWF